MENKKVLKVSILSISFLLMLRLTISPALAEIGKAFPDVSQGALMNMVALPSMVAIIFGFFSGLLSSFVKKKTILIVALVLFLIGGLGPIFANSFNVILLLRTVLGAGTGLFLPFAAGLIVDFFDGNERNTMFGLQSTAVAVGNIITGLLAGVLATISWRLSFLIYAFALISFVLVVFNVPEPERVVVAKSKENRAIGKRGLMICLVLFLYAITYFSFFGYLSFVIDENKLGNAAASGLASMLMTLASIFMGILFGKLIKRLKGLATFFSIIPNAIGYFFLANATNMAMIFIGSICIGLGFGFLMPLATMKLNDSVPKAAAAFANGLFMTFINIGTAISPTILILVGKIFHNESGQFIYLFCGIVLSAASVIALIMSLVAGKASVAEEVA